MQNIERISTLAGCCMLCTGCSALTCCVPVLSHQGAAPGDLFTATGIGRDAGRHVAGEADLQPGHAHKGRPNRPGEEPFSLASCHMHMHILLAARVNLDEAEHTQQACRVTCRALCCPYSVRCLLTAV